MNVLPHTCTTTPDDLHRSMRHLSQDVSRNIRRQRENIDRIDTLTKKLIKLKAMVSSTGTSNGPHADTLVENEIRERFRGEASKVYSKCSKCGARVLLSLLPKHEPLCIGAPEEDDVLEETAEQGEANEERRQAARARHEAKKKEKARFNASKKKKPVILTAPQAPRKVYCGGTTHNSINMRWSEPILDGGAFIFEYEITYSEVFTKTVGKKVLETVVEQTPVSCSRWIFKEPIHETGFNLEHLKGVTEYRNFTVRCRNEVSSLSLIK